MKEYSKMILWLDYFNSSNSRSKGRRIPLTMAVRDPSLDELIDAAKRVGYTPESQTAINPKRYSSVSGYICLERAKPKSLALKRIATVLKTVRSDRK